MKLAKRFATISAAVTAAVLFSAGGAQAQSGGGLLSLLSDIPLLGTSYPLGLAGQGGTSTGAQTTNNNNNNNNTGGGPNNNNNNNGGGTNNNNNNNNGDSQTQTGGAGVLPLLGKSLINFQICLPKGQVGSSNTLTGNQNINCHQN
ncbi:hypothetical protein ABT189_36505 [Streptomyces sp900105755]|uniref:hypothetical protein n=1 Tax=Streptomyces sp. 900105755 TaxID=3154389 RepID=UPI003323596D